MDAACYENYATRLVNYELIVANFKMGHSPMRDPIVSARYS